MSSSTAGGSRRSASSSSTGCASSRRAAWCCAGPADAARDPAPCVERLAEALRPWRGGRCADHSCSTAASRTPRACARRSAPEWSVRPTRELIDQLEALVGREGRRAYAPPARDRPRADGLDAPAGCADRAPRNLRRPALATGSAANGRQLSSISNNRSPSSKPRSRSCEHVTSDSRGEHPGRDRAAAGQEPPAHDQHLRAA